MDKLINETVEIARKHFQGFGFEDEQIVPLLEAGKRDLTKELDKLRTLVANERIDIDVLNLSLHALKGLLLNMGNSEVADKLNELREEEQVDAQLLDDIKAMLD